MDQFFWQRNVSKEGICIKLAIASLESKFLCECGWRRDVVVITTAQLYSTKPELRFYPGSNPARNVPEIRDGEDL